MALVLIIAATGVAIWAGWLQRRPSIPRWVRYVPPVLLVSAALCALLTVLGLRRAFEAVAHADPAEKAARLSAGIASAMHALWIGFAIVLAATLLLSYLMLRGRASGGE